MADTTTIVRAVTLIVEAAERKEKLPPTAIFDLEATIKDFGREAGALFMETPASVKEAEVPPVYTNPGGHLEDIKAAGKRFVAIANYLNETIGGYEEPGAGPGEKQRSVNEIVGIAGIPGLRWMLEQIKASSRAMLAELEPDQGTGAGMPTDTYNTVDALKRIEASQKLMHEKLDTLLREF